MGARVVAGAQKILLSSITQLVLPCRANSTRCLPPSTLTLSVSSAKAAEHSKVAVTVRLVRNLVAFMVWSSIDRYVLKTLYRRRGPLSLNSYTTGVCEIHVLAG